MKINKDSLMKIVILLGFFLVFICILLTGRIKTLVHARIVPFIILSVLLMGTSMIVLLQDLFKGGRKRVNLITLTIYLTTIVISVYYLINTYNSNNNIHAEYMENAELVSIKPEEFVDFVNNDIEIDSNVDIRIVGFINKEGNSVFISRSIMTCCAADMYTVGIECSGEDIDGFREGQWVEAIGRVSTEGERKFEVKKAVANETVDKSPIQHKHD